MVNESVLVVEDEGIVAMHIENILKSLGYTVSGTVSSGEETIEKVKNFRTDLILMDIVLKGKMDGIEAADHIRNNFDVPVIFLTAYGNESTLHRLKLPNLTDICPNRSKKENCILPSRLSSINMELKPPSMMKKVSLRGSYFKGYQRAKAG